MTLHYLNFKLLLLSLLIFSLASAQDKRVNIISNFHDVYVAIDSVYVGIAPIENYITDKDTIRISTSNNSFDVWESERQTFDIAITKDTIIELLFKKKINITTEPTWAELHLDNNFIGISPLQIYLYSYADNNLEIKKTYYETKIINLNGSESNSLHIDLKLLDNKLLDFNNDEKNFNSKKITYFIVGGLTAGLVSGFTKMRSDAIEKEYNSNLDPALKNSIQTYNMVSNISLAIFGGCFLCINYLLLRD